MAFSVSDLDTATFPTHVRWLISIVFVAFLVGGILLSDARTDPGPLKSEAFGCYSSNSYSRILISKQGFYVLDEASEPSNFDLVQTNSGLRLEFEKAPLNAFETEAMRDLVRDRYVSFEILTNLNTPALVDGFAIPELDRTTIFVRASAKDCQ